MLLWDIFPTQNFPWSFSISCGRIFLQGLGSVRRTILLPLGRMSLTSEICSRSLPWPCSSLKKSWKKLQEEFPPPWLAAAFRGSCTCLSLSHLVQSRVALSYSAAMPVPVIVPCWSGLWTWPMGWLSDCRTGLSPFIGEAMAPACRAVILGFQILFSLLKSNCFNCSLRDIWDPQEGWKDWESKVGASVRVLPISSFSQGASACPSYRSVHPRLGLGYRKNRR